MRFEQLMKDTVFIVKANGERSGPFMSALGKDKCSIHDKSIDVDPGDVLARPLPNGKEEHYTILRADYRDDFRSIPGGYDLELRKSQQLHPQPSHIVNNVSITHSSGFQVGNHNLQTIELALNQLLQAIEAHQATPAEKAEAKSRLQVFLEHPLVVAVLGGIAGGAA